MIRVPKVSFQLSGTFYSLNVPARSCLLNRIVQRCLEICWDINYLAVYCHCLIIRIFGFPNLFFVVFSLRCPCAAIDHVHTCYTSFIKLFSRLTYLRII